MMLVQGLRTLRVERWLVLLDQLGPGPCSSCLLCPLPVSPHRQAGQVQGRRPAGTGRLVAAAAAALPASPAGHGFRLPVTCDQLCTEDAGNPRPCSDSFLLGVSRPLPQPLTRLGETGTPPSGVPCCMPSSTRPPCPPTPPPPHTTGFSSCSRAAAASVVYSGFSFLFLGSL